MSKPSLINPDDPLYESELGKQMRDPSIKLTDPDSPINKVLGSILTSTAMLSTFSRTCLSEDWRTGVLHHVARLRGLLDRAGLDRPLGRQ